MRDSLIAILVISAGVFLYRHADPSIFKSRIQIEAEKLKSTASTFQVSHPNVLAKGEQHDERKHQRTDAKAQDPRQGEGGSGEPSTVESLPTIYKKKRSPRPAVVADSKESSTSKSQGKEDKKNVYGVPVDDWVETQRDSVALPVPDDIDDRNIRVFLQCMELKKHGPEALKERECRGLLANRPQTEERLSHTDIR